LVFAPGKWRDGRRAGRNLERQRILLSRRHVPRNKAPYRT
jgi:hypothetical protein